MMNATILDTDDINGSLVDDWETYKAYTRFYHIADEVFLYANPILILIGQFHLIGIIDIFILSLSLSFQAFPHMHYL